MQQVSCANGGFCNVQGEVLPLVRSLPTFPFFFSSSEVEGSSVSEHLMLCRKAGVAGVN